VNEGEKQKKLSRGLELSGEAIGAAIEVHKLKGPGLNESIYQKCMGRELTLRSIEFVCEKQVEIEYRGFIFEDTLRTDIIMENGLILELKAVEKLLPIHTAQLLTYMKLLDIPVGLLINFNETLLKKGVRRLILKEYGHLDDSDENHIF